MTGPQVGGIGLYGVLTVLTAVLALTFAACAFVYVRRLENRPPNPLGEIVGVRKKVLTKVRKGEPMSQEEFDYATQTITDCRSPLALTMPATSFCVGCFYIVGCLYQLHGATPTARVLIGLFPMLGSTNLAIQLLRVGRLKKRLRNVTIAESDESDVLQAL
jgi:hypothetical protein